MSLQIIAQQFYSAAMAQDWHAVELLISDTFYVEEAPGLPFGGIYEGLQGLKTLNKRVFGHFHRFNVYPNLYLEGEQQVAVWIRAQGVGRKTHCSFETEICEWLEFSDQRIASIKPFYFDEALINTV